VNLSQTLVYQSNTITALQHFCYFVVYIRECTSLSPLHNGCTYNESYDSFINDQKLEVSQITRKPS